MRLSLDELGFFGVFIGFTLYLIAIIDGVTAKLAILGWLLCILSFAIYVLVKRDKEEDEVPVILEWDIR